MPKGKPKQEAVEAGSKIFEKDIRVRVTFLDEILGSLPGDPELHETYIARKAPNAEQLAEELDSMDINEEITKGMTIFPVNHNGERMLWPYQVKGFIKNAQKFLNLAAPKTNKQYITMYRMKIDQLVFIKATDADWGDLAGIRIHYPETVLKTDVTFDGSPSDWPECERPLRASTPMGERVAIAHSESCPPGSWVEFDIKVIGDKQLAGNITEWLDYGIYSGIGQWRNSGKGRFTWREITPEEITA